MSETNHTNYIIPSRYLSEDFNLKRLWNPPTLTPLPWIFDLETPSSTQGKKKRPIPFRTFKLLLSEHSPLGPHPPWRKTVDWTPAKAFQT